MAAIYLLALLPPAVMLASVARHAVNVPLWDEWEFPLLMTRLEAGELSVPELAWLQRGEHRKIFPHLIVLALAHLTHYNVVAHIYLAAVLRLVALGLVWRLLIRTVAPAASPWTAGATLLASLFLFSAAEYENWIWGESAIMVALINLALVTMVWALARWPDRWCGWLLALAAATVGAFSAASGLLLYGVGLVGLVLDGRLSGRSWADRFAFAWIAGATVLTLLFFAGWERRFQTDVVLVPGVEMMKHHLAYTLSYLGAPLEVDEVFWWSAVAGLVGLLAIAVMVIAVRRGGDRREPRRLTPWLLLALFAATTAVLTSVGRSGFGLELPSRYVGISSLLWIATAALVAIVCRRWSAWSPGALTAVVGCLGVLLLGYIKAYEKGYDRLRDRGRTLADKKVYLRHHESAGHQLRGLYPRLEPLIPRVAALQALEMGVFDDPTRREHLRVYAEPEIPEQVAIPLGPGGRIEQTFVSRCGDLESLFLRVDVGHGGAPSTLRIRLRDEASGRTLVGGPVTLRAGRRFHRIGLGAKSSPTGPGRYRLVIGLQGGEGASGPTLWRSAADALPGGELRLDGEPASADLVFRRGCAALRPGADHPFDLAPGFAENQVAWHRAVVDGVSREVIYMVPPQASAAWVLTLPASGRALFASGLLVASSLPGKGDADEGWAVTPPPGDGVRFRLTVESDDERPEELLSLHVDPWSHEADRRFVPVTADLDRWRGRSIVVRLATDPGPSGHTDWDLSGWAEPRVSVIPASEPDQP